MPKYRFILPLVLLCTWIVPHALHAQGEWNQFYDYSRKYHFGFMIGTNTATFKYKFAPSWYAQDTIKRVSVQRLPGITLGVVGDLHLGEYFNLRVVPSLVLSQRNVLFVDNANIKSTKEIESAFVELPILLKYKSVRHRNIRYYVIGGGKYSYDLSSDENAKRNPADPKIFLKQSNYNYEFGTGLDLYFKYFKFSPEVKLSRGLNNILVPDARIYSNIFQSFRSNMVFFSLYFEG